VAQPTSATDLIPMTLEERLKFLKRAENGDTTTRPALRKLFQLAQNFDDLGGNLARQAELALIGKIAGKNLTHQEILVRQLGLMRAELAGPTPSPLERLLVERAATCWLHLQHLELLYANKDSMSLVQAAHYQACIDRGHKRYLSAINMLARVRRLALPVLQVNIARKQVNVAAPGAVGESGRTNQAQQAKEGIAVSSASPSDTVSGGERKGDEPTERDGGAGNRFSARKRNVPTDRDRRPGGQRRRGAGNCVGGQGRGRVGGAAGRE
jgi:hypothetical protein